MTVRPASSTWFLHQKLHPQPRLRLFCFPYAGGTASAFLNWSSYLPPGVEVWPVQLPGRQNRFSEPPATQISTLVQAITPALQENKELVRMMMPTLRADFEAAETYRYTGEEPFDCPITVFGGTEDYSVTSDELVAWHHQTTGTFRFHLFPGDHFFIHSHQANLLKAISGEITQIIGD